MGVKVLAVPDAHFPWADIKQLDEVIAAAHAEQPDYIVNLGDTYDFYCFSRFTRNLDFITPGDELRRGREHYQTMWKALQWVAPRAKCVQLLGNHDMRLRIQTAHKFPEMNSVLDALGLEDFFWGADGVEVQNGPRPFYFIDEVGYHHGDWLRSMTIGARVKDALHSVVFGHTHKAWVTWLPRRSGQLFEMSCGNIGYTQALPFLYPPSDIPATTNGFGIVDGRKPRFVPL